jgi:hypothetical protein
MARDFVVTRPQEADAPRIAEIHLAAMDANPLLHAQFPARDSLRALQRFMEDYALEQLRNPATGFLVARDPETDVVAGFAKWDSPSHPADVKLESGDLRYLEGCRREFLDGYASLAEEAKKRCFGEQACYCMCYQLSPVFYAPFPDQVLHSAATLLRIRGLDFGPARCGCRSDLYPVRPGSPALDEYRGLTSTDY